METISPYSSAHKEALLRTAQLPMVHSLINPSLEFVAETKAAALLFLRHELSRRLADECAKCMNEGACGLKPDVKCGVADGLSGG